MIYSLLYTILNQNESKNNKSKGKIMKRYQAVIETSKQNSTLRYTSKPYNTKKEALTDLNQELKRVSKKDQTVTLATIKENPLPKEIAEMILAGVATLEDDSQEQEFIALCQNRAFNFSLTWQKMDDWSLEIYTGYSKHSYELRFYTDGHSKREDAIKEGLEYMRDLKARKVRTLAPQF